MSIRCCKRKDLFLILTTVLLTIAVLGCGKKSNPTLKSYEKPETPSELSVVQREDAMLVKWAYPASKENLIAQFIVLRSAGSDFEKLSHITREKRSYTDKDITVGSRYDYKVISQNPRGVYSNDSATASAIPVAASRAPQKLSYTISGDALILKWDQTDKGTLFNVYRSLEKGRYSMIPVNQEPLSTPMFKDTFYPNSVLHYTVRSLAEGKVRGEGPASEELTVDAADLVPPMPLKLQAFPAADKVILSWEDLEEIWVTGFNVYRRAGSGNFVLLGKTETPTFLDPEPPASKRDYRVAAVGLAKEGPAAEIRDVIFIPQR